MEVLRGRRWKRALVWLAGIGIAGWFLAFGPPGLAEIPARPEFCTTCHLMDLEYDAWRVSAHNAQICGDCHLPAETVSHYAWDAYFGMRDMWEFFVTGDYPEIIRAKPVSQDFLADNCLRCHGAKVHAARVEDRRCWDCHRSVMHRQTLWGIEQGARLPR